MEKKFQPVKNNEDGILTKMFRKIIFETGFVNNLNYFINRYIKAGGKKNKATISKIILDGEMTWKSFTFLIFEVLKVKKMKITITLEHINNTETTHEIIVSPRKSDEVTKEEKLKFEDTLKGDNKNGSDDSSAKSKK